VSAGLAFTTIVVDGGAPVTVLQLRVTEVMAVPALFDVANRLVALNTPCPAVNATSTGKMCEA
jgi:hypothetical protein